MRYFTLLLFPLILFTACGYGGGSAASAGSQATADSSSARMTPVEREDHPFADSVEKAQGIEEWLSHDAIQYELALRLGEKTLLAQVLMKTDFSRIRIITDKKETLIYDGEYVYLSPKDAEWRNPRFDVFTWPYFMAAPFKLNDPGTQIEPKGEAELLGESCTTAKLSFEAGVGDSPKDWYYLYRSDSSHLLRGMGYIVTYFNDDQEQAEQNPHAITYHTFGEFEGLTLPTEWRFWNWSEEGGLGERRGTARLAKYRFVEADKFSFSVPYSYRKYNAEGELVN